MAGMAAAQPSPTPHVITVGRRRPPLLWVGWILVSVAGAIAGALVAWQIRAFPGSPAPASMGDLLRYVATIAEAIVLAGGQWFFLRRQGLDVYWWVPASVTAALVNAMVVIPTVLHAVLPNSPVGAFSLSSAVIAGACSLAAAGMVRGAAQALVLRTSRGTVAFVWIPATILGGALAGGLTTAVSMQLLGLPTGVAIGAVAAFGAVLTSAAQAPVISRLLR
jgi:hypothetical protein